MYCQQNHTSMAYYPSHEHFDMPTYYFTPYNHQNQICPQIPHGQKEYHKANGSSHSRFNNRTRKETQNARLYQKGMSPETCESDTSMGSEEERPKTNKLKVELCKNYVANGCCPYEDRCRFAHGLGELRTQAPQHSQLYRTRPCKTYYQMGQCRFGERCNFRHEGCKPLGKKGSKIGWLDFWTEASSSSQSRLMNLLKAD